MKVHLEDNVDGKRCLAILFMLTLFLSAEHNLLSQDVQSKPVRQSASEAFSKGDYELAYKQFSELLVSFPKDPLYKYYSGICLVKLEKEPEKALTLLQEAQQGASVVRTIPSDALFWLGRAQHLSGKYSEAISSYNGYSQLAGRKASRELKIAEYIQQCSNKKGQITGSSGIAVTAAGNEKPLSGSGKTVNRDGSAPVQNISKQAPVKEALPKSYDRILSEALSYQKKADSLYRISDDLKRDLDSAAAGEKAEIRAKITGAENLAFSFQKQADQKYREAQSEMNSGFFSKNEGSAQKSNLIPDSAGHKTENAKQTVKSAETARLADTAAAKPAIVSRQPETPPVTKTGVFSVFGVIQKPVYAKNEKIEVNPAAPSGLIYRIQLAVFRNPVAPSIFKGITPVYGFKAAGNDLTTYFAGMFRRLTDAKKALATVKQKGFKDSFIVAFFSGKPVSAERAAILEKEWSGKPFTTGVRTASDAPRDTVPPALLFKVEVIRSAKPLKDDVMEGLRKISGTRGLETITFEDGNTVYLIGKFITFESAEAYADLLIRNGYRNAKVVAWIGNKEIPVETAKQLFEKIE